MKASERRGPVASVAPWIVAGLIVAGVVAFASSRDARATLHCGPGLEPRTTRCCAPGQREEAGRCSGEPASCPPPLERTAGGCVAKPARISIAAGVLDRSASDWEAVGAVAARRITIDAFDIDAFEVTEARWARCADAGACARLDLTGEPGLPITNVTADEAVRFCAFEGGSLPTPEQLAYAGAGPEGHRYPWGPTGAVCRRAAWGRARGPCARDAKGPELAGVFPDGATPTGIHDLAGNVAEWSRSADGSIVEVRGGSFRDDAAASLRTWAYRTNVPDARQDDVGFRCVYAAGSTRY
ncbi:MAG: SUMF1/EgtB/PvdO family nonheme iron enzyme [Polyangiaceae bacterium]|nr:SUMF1/EgtB/PvdO family nonheme iron enzyme [Polyangiaceae bacterium]